MLLTFLPNLFVCSLDCFFASGFFAFVVALVFGVSFAAFEALEGDMELKMGFREGEMEGSGTRILPKS